MITQTLIYGLIAFAGTAIAVELSKRPARRVGLLDHPRGRKRHDRATPLCGGPVLTVIFCAMVLLLGLLPSGAHAGLVVGMLILAGIGVADDLLGLSVRWRLAVQIGVALGCVVVWGNLDLASVGNLVGLGEVELGHFAIPCAVFCVVGVINAFNLSDGLDGLAGGLALIALCYFTGMVLSTGDAALCYLLVVLIGGVLGFLAFNMRTPWRARASVFMGDSGSMGLGFALCWLALEMSQGVDRAMTPITAVWILGLPIVDTINVMLSRIRRGHSPFRAGRDHLHHALLGLGLTSGQTVNVLLGASGVMGAVGVSGFYCGVPESVMFFALIALAASYMLTMRHLTSRGMVLVRADAEG